MKLLIKYCLIVFIVLLVLSSAIADEPKRIISLAPSITESLYQLGAEEDLIGVTSYCNYPPEARTKEIIGTLINPNIEKIYSLSPDLVLALKGINRSQTIEKLRDLGLKVITFDECNSFDAVAKNFTQLGQLTQREEKARDIVRAVEEEMNSITKKTKELLPVKVFWEIGARPLVTAGANSFANEFIEYSGGINIFADTSISYPRVSREEVLAKNPQVIVLVTMGNVTEKEKAYWQKFKDLEATKNNRIYVVGADKVCRPTPISFLTGLKEVARLLHPEAFKKVE